MTVGFPSEGPHPAPLFNGYRRYFPVVKGRDVCYSCTR